jgi:hypothetical protein
MFSGSGAIDPVVVLHRRERPVAASFAGTITVHRGSGHQSVA